MQERSKQATVLVVDASSVIRSRLLDALGALDKVCVVGGTDSLREGLALARRHRPDLVILDVRLSDGRGADSIREFTACRPVPAVAVLMSCAQFPYRERFLERGADFCFDRAKELHGLVQMVASRAWARSRDSARPASRRRQPPPGRAPTSSDESTDRAETRDQARRSPSGEH